MFQPLSHFCCIIRQIDKSNSTFAFAHKEFGFGKYSIFTLYHVLFIYPAIQQFIISFHLTYYLSPSLLISFSILFFFFFLILFLQIFFVKRSNSFFPIKIINNKRPRYSIFSFFNHKNFFRPIWSVTFGKNIFLFWYSSSITNFKFRMLIINLFTGVNIYV